MSVFFAIMLLFQEVPSVLQESHVGLSNDQEYCLIEKCSTT